MIIDEDVYLEHFGVKGMHWGVRKEIRKQEHTARLKRWSEGTSTRADRAAVRKRTGTASKAGAIKELNNPKLTKDAIANKMLQKVATGVWGAVAIGYVGAFLYSKGLQKTKSIPVSPLKAKSAADFIKDRLDVEMTSLTRMHKEGKMDKGQYDNFSKILTDRYNRKITEALKIA